jgi:hypothetical protein
MSCIKLQRMCLNNIFHIVPCIYIPILPTQKDKTYTVVYFFIKDIPIIMPWGWKLCHRFGTGLIGWRTMCSTNKIDQSSKCDLYGIACDAAITKCNFNNIWQQTVDFRSNLNSWNAYCRSLPENLIFLSSKIVTKIYKTIILSVVSYGCETWALSLREDHRLRVFENRVPSGILEL